jgi:S1-C subfamily serine protease
MQPVSVPETLRKVVPGVTGALLVVHAEASGPAEKAGVLLGDLLTELQGKTVEDTDDVQDLLASLKVGDTVNATILRGGTPIRVAIEVEDRPAR